MFSLTYQLRPPVRMSLISLEGKKKTENKMYVILLYCNILLVYFVPLESRLGRPLLTSSMPTRYKDLKCTKTGWLAFSSLVGQVWGGGGEAGRDAVVATSSYGSACAFFSGWWWWWWSAGVDAELNHRDGTEAFSLPHTGALLSGAQLLGDVSQETGKTRVLSHP